MTTSTLDRLPAIVSMDILSVLGGDRRGSSLQFDETFLEGQRRALRAVPAGVIRANRLEKIDRSLERFRAIDVDLDRMSRDDLWQASEQFRRDLETVPEIEFITRAHPGKAFVVPEWLQTGRHLRYGARLYFLRDDDPIAPSDILATNIEAILDDSLGPFERLQGELHGYPECCIAFYQDRSPTHPSPEWRAVEPHIDTIERAVVEPSNLRLTEGVETLVSFFTREFFPDPRCEVAERLGRSIRATMARSIPVNLVDTYFCINAGLSYLVARAVHSGADRRPEPGDLGPEHLGMYEPFGYVRARFADDDSSRP